MPKFIAGALIASLALISHTRGGTLIPVPATRDIIFDSTRNLLYMPTSSGQIERFDPITGLLLSPFTVGGSLRGGDTTPNGQFLYVADHARIGANSIIRKVDLNIGASVNLAYANESFEDGAWDVVVMNNGLAFTTGDFSGSGWVHLRQLRLATDTFTIRVDNVRERTQLNRSSDRNKFIGLEGDVSNRPIFDYIASSDSFPHARDTNDLSPAIAAASYNGQFFAMRNQLLNSSLFQLNLLPFSVGGLYFDPLRNLMYVADYNTDQLIGYSLGQTELFRLPIGEDISPSDTFRPTQMTISDDTKYIFLTTPNGVRFFNNPIAIPEPPTMFFAIVVCVGSFLSRRKSMPHIGPA